MEGGLSSRPTECRYCPYLAPKGRCHGKQFLAFHIGLCGAHWCHPANTTEPPVCGSDAALRQITLTTCSFCYISTLYVRYQYTYYSLWIFCSRLRDCDSEGKCCKESPHYKHMTQQKDSQIIGPWATAVAKTMRNNKHDYFTINVSRAKQLSVIHCYFHNLLSTPDNCVHHNEYMTSWVWYNLSQLKLESH